MAERLIRLPEILSRVPFRRSTLYARIAAGRFPKPLKIGSRIATWRESDIDQAINDLIAEGERGEAA